jgi:hypothetical protein
MKQKNKNRPIRVAAGLSGLCLSCSAVASPPFSWEGSSPNTIASARSISLASRPVARRELMPNTNLDLRAPRASTSAISRDGTSAFASEAFPSMTHHLETGKPDSLVDDRIQARALSIGELNFRVMSQAQFLASRVHREGLPLARLFESKSALLSVGLNKRGKPGLWFTQQTH